MLYLAIKVLLSAGVIVLASELAKRSTLLGALIVSLPLVSVLAMSWLYVETGDARRVASLSTHEAARTKAKRRRSVEDEKHH